MLEIEFHYSNNGHVSINVTNYFGSISWKIISSEDPIMKHSAIRPNT